MSIRVEQPELIVAAQTVVAELKITNALLASIAEALVTIAQVLKSESSPIVGIKAAPGVPTPHMKGSTMQIKLTKKSAIASKKAAPKATGPVGGFNLQDNEDDSFTVFGTDAAGNQVDISGVATLTASSDNTAVLTVDPPTGMTSKMHAVGPTGSANVLLTATWNDGSVGPFSITWPITVTAGGATGITVVPGTPTIH